MHRDGGPRELCDLREREGQRQRKMSFQDPVPDLCDVQPFLWVLNSVKYSHFL